MGFFGYKVNKEEDKKKDKWREGEDYKINRIWGVVVKLDLGGVGARPEGSFKATSRVIEAVNLARMVGQDILRIKL